MTSKQQPISFHPAGSISRKPQARSACWRSLLSCAVASCILGSAWGAEVDLTPVSTADGTFASVTVGGQTAWQNTGTSRYLYGRRPNSFSFTTGQTLYLRVTYFDDLAGAVDLQFDAQTSSTKSSTLTTRTTRVNSGRFVDGFFELPDVRFNKSLNGSDFRIVCGTAPGAMVPVQRITLSDTPFTDPDFQLAVSRAWKNRYTGPAKDYVDTTTLKGKVMTGYQGWFGTPNDIADAGGWKHWSRAAALVPENFTMDAWPDLTEYDPATLIRAADIVTGDGAPAYLFSSRSYSSVQKHFRWMRKHNIDGAFLQRFHPKAGADSEWVLRNVSQAAAEEGLIWAVEYDVSGMAAATVAAKLQADWEWLTTEFDLLNDPRYVRENGKPVVFIWGLPFPTKAQGLVPFDVTIANTAVDYFKNQGAYVIGGIPNSWNSLSAAWKSHIEKYNGVLVWQNGSTSDATFFRNRGQDFYPHVWPGFSWANLQQQPATPPIEFTDRSGGQFYWNKGRDWINGGNADRLFIGMFDEYDEATNVMPMTDDPPDPSAAYGRFITNQGKPTDWWMLLTDELKRMMFGQRTNTGTMPSIASLANRSNIGAEASIDLGTNDLNISLTRVVTADGNTIVETVAGKECRGNTTPATDRYLYFNVNNAFAFQLANGDVTVEVEYYDSLYGSATGTVLGLQYDSATAAFTNHPQSITTTGSNTWRTVRFEIADGYFGGRQNGSADFRLNFNGKKCNVNRVWVRLPEGKSYPFSWTNSTVGPALTWSQNANWLGGIVAQSDPTSTVRLYHGQTLPGGAIPITNNLTAQQFGTLQLGGNAASSADTTVTLSGNALSLGGTSPTLALDAMKTAFDLTYDIAAPVTLLGLTQITGAGNATFRISGVLSGSGGLSKTHSGTLTLSGANTYTGSTNLLNGKLQLEGGNNRLPVTTQLNLGTGSNFAEFDLNGRNQQIAGLAVTAGATATSASVNNTSPTPATLTIHSAAASSYAGNLQGNLALTKTGADVLTLTGTNLFTGDTTIASGTLALSGSGSIANTPNIIVSSGATLDVSAPATSLTLGTAQTLKTSGTGGSTTGTLRVASGKNLSLGNAMLGLEFTAFGGGATAPLTLAGTGGSLNLNGRPIKVTTTSPLSGGPHKLIAKSGSATVTGTPGTLIVAGSGFATSGTLSVISGELFLTLAAPPTYTITNTTNDPNGTCTPTGVVSVAGGASQTYTLTPNTDFAVATLTVNGAPVPPALSYTFSNVSANQTISATFVSKAILYWDSNNTTPGFGNTTGTWGTTSFWSADASGSSAPLPITTANNSAVNFGSATLNYDNAAVSVAAGGVNVGNITFGAGQSTILTISGGPITLGAVAVITVDNAASAIASVLTGAGTSLTKAGTGSLTLSAANTYSGETAIATGTLRLGAAHVLPDGPGSGNVVVAGTLDLNSFSETINGLSGVGIVDTLTGGTPTLTLGGNNATSAFNGSITNTAGTLTLVKTGNGTITLTGANSYSGPTTLNNGTLALSGTGTLGSNSSGITLSGGQLDLGGLSRTQGAISITAPAATGDTIRNGDLTGTSYTVSNPSGNAIISAALGGSGGFTKSGNGTVTLSGANSYTGTTTLGAGTLAITNTSSLTGGLTFGDTTGSATASALDLSNGNATYGGPFTVQTHTSANNTITIGAGRTLATNGNVTIGANTGVGIVTNLTAAGDGSWNITNSAASGNFQIGAATGATNTNPASLDLSGLATFNANLSGASSVFRLGDTSSAGSTPVGSLKLATNSTLTAATLGVSDSSGSGTMRTLSLGTGVNRIHANHIRIGEAANQRGSGTLNFQDTVNGTLVIRSQSGALSTADLTIVNTGNSGGTAQTGRLLLAGHTADVSLDAIVMASRSNGTSTANATAEITFDDGNFSANSIAMTGRTGSSLSGTATGTITLGGGTASLGAVTMAVNTNTNATTGLSNATLTINNGTVTAASINMANAGSTGIAKTANANLNLNGGSLTLTTGNITRTGGSGIENAIIKLDGGTLNMNGRNIGNSTAVISLVAQSGTLQNITSINGTGGLTKTTADTLLLSGTNSYTGTTTVNEGTLALGSNTALPDASTVSLGTATLDAATAGIEDAGTLAVTGTATLNLAAGARIEFDPSNGTWPGTLNLTGSFVSGVSLRFGNSLGLSPAQLSQISADGFTGFALNSSGYLVADIVFSTWIKGTFVNGQVPTNQQGPHDDPDHDGIRNLIEYAIADQDPTVAHPTVGTFTGTLLSFTKRPGTSGLTYAIQQSTDLGLAHSWTAVTGAGYVNNLSNISFTLTLGSPVKNFLRLQVLSN